MSGLADAERFDVMPVGKVCHRRKWRVIRTDNTIPDAGQRARHFILLHEDGGTVTHVFLERGLDGQLFTYDVLTGRGDVLYGNKSDIDSSGLGRYGLMVPAMWGHAKRMERAGTPLKLEFASEHAWPGRPPHGAAWLKAAPRSAAHSDVIPAPKFVRERFPRRKLSVPALPK